MGLKEADKESIKMVQGKDSYSLALGGISGRSKKCEQSSDIQSMLLRSQWTLEWQCRVASRVYKPGVHEKRTRWRATYWTQCVKMVHGPELQYQRTAVVREDIKA